MTFYHELRGVPLDAYNKCCNEVLRRASSQLGLPREELILRDLRSDDLGVTGKWGFTVTSTEGWNTLISTVTVADNRFICLSGMFTDESTPLIHSVRITRAGSVARWWNTQRVGNQDDSELHFNDPIIFDQNTTVTIEGYNGITTTSVNEECGWIGCIAEKRGLVINP